MIRIMPNMSDNFYFHHCEYITIRPWIKSRLEELGIECDIKYDNDSLFLLYHIDDISSEFCRDDVDDMINNKYSTEFFIDYIHMNGFSGHVRVSDLLRHEHATSILWHMLETLAIFENFDYDRNQKIIKWIDDDVLWMILRGMEPDEVETIKYGVDQLNALKCEQEYTYDTTLHTILSFVSSNISDKEGSVEYLHDNITFVNEEVVMLNPHWREFYTDFFQCAYTICRNYNAGDLLKRLRPDQINWIDVCTFYRDVQLIEDNIDKVDWVSILRNAYMMPVIERHIDKINLTLLQELSSNSSAIYYLEQHPELVNERILSNSNIVTYNYDAIKLDRAWLKQGLAEYFYHPRLIEKWLSDGNNLDDYMIHIT